MVQNISRSGLLFFSILSLLTAIGCTKKQSTDTFVYCSEGSPSGFNPQLVTDGASFNAGAHAIYNTLVDFQAGGAELEPSLAESWKFAPDNLSVVFNLRKGVKWQTTAGFTPTRDFNADDVIFTFERQMKKDHPYAKVSGGNYQYFESMEMAAIIKEIKKTDDYTVEFILNKKEAPFIANIAMPFASILSAEYADLMAKAKTMEKVDTDPVGTGAFVLVSYQKDTLIRYKANPTYWKGKPKTENLVFSITPDASVRTQKLKAGECHLIAEPSPQDLDALKKDSNLNVVEKEGLNVGYLAMNVQKPPFDKIEVRQAINYALNRASYIDAIYLNRAMVAKNVIPPILWSYNNDVVDYEYNPEKAKELLKKVGLEKGFETEMWTLPVSRPYNPAGKKMGELMQADLEKIGIKVKLVTFDWTTYLKNARTGEHQMLQLGWTGDNGDPDNFFNVLLGCAGIESGSNVARWCFKPFDSLVAQAKEISDQKLRTELYMKAQVIFKEQAPWVTLAHAKVYRALAKNVQGYQIHPFGSEKFENIVLTLAK